MPLRHLSLRAMSLLLAWLPLPAFAAAAQEPDPLAGMSLRDRVAQLFIVPVFSNSTGYEMQRYLDQLRPGGIIILGENLEDAWAVKRVCDYIGTAHRNWKSPVPMFTSINQEGGIVNRLLRNVVLFPSAMAIGATGSTNLAYQAGLAMGRQLAAAGLNMNYAPVLDVNYNARNPVIGTRAFSDDPQTVLEIGSAYARGQRAAGVIAVAKHLPGHGRTAEDSHWFLPRVETPVATLLRTCFSVFARMDHALMPAVMTAHVIYTNIDPLPATLSRKIIGELFRKANAYDGLILTDDIFMSALSRHRSYAEIVQLALEAGCDVISTSLSFDANQFLINHLVKLVEKGTLPEERINQSVRRVLATKRRYRMFDAKPVAQREAAAMFHTAELQQLSDRIADQAVTRMQDPQGVLPLAGVGPYLVASANQYFSAKLIAYLRQRNPGAQVHQAWIPRQMTVYHAAALRQQASAYKVVVFAGSAWDDGLAVDQLRRLKATKVVIASLFDPYFVVNYPGDYAYTAAFSPFLNSADACAKAIAGVIPFQGKPPITLWPKK